MFCVKPISTTRFSFSPSICYVISGSKKINFLPIAAIGLKFGGWVGSRHQVGTNDTPYRGQNHRGGGWRGKWHVHHLQAGGARSLECPTYHPSHALSRKRLGRLSTNFACMKTDPQQMFCTSQVRISTAHAHNIFLLYLGRYKTVKNPLFTNGSYWAEIWWVGSRHQVATNDTPYRGQTHRGAWWREGERHVQHLPITFQDTGGERFDDRLKL